MYNPLTSSYYEYFRIIRDLLELSLSVPIVNRVVVLSKEQSSVVKILA